VSWKRIVIFFLNVLRSSSKLWTVSWILLISLRDAVDFVAEVFFAAAFFTVVFFTKDPSY
jgi:hypothetical protein